MSQAMYNRGKTEILNGELNLDIDTIKVLIVTSGSYVYDADHNFLAEVTGAEASAGGYVRKTLASVSITQDDTNNYAVFDAADVTWEGITVNGGGAILFKDSGSNANVSPLIMYSNTQFPVTITGGNLQIVWSTSGILAL